VLHAEGLLFDLDGVIVDSHEVVERHWRQFASWHGLDATGLSKRALGRPSLEAIQRELPHLSTSELQEAASRFYVLEETDTAGVTWVVGAETLLDSLPDDRWAVVTSCGRKLAEARIDAVGLGSPMHLVTADDVHRGKPDPEGFLAGASLLDVDAQRCIVFEDAPTGLEAAVRSGATPVGVATGTPVDQLRAAMKGNGVVVEDLRAVTVREAGGVLRVEIEELQR